MITGFNHMSFTVTDMDRVVRFWTDALGFEARSVSPRSGNWQEKVTGVRNANLLVAHLYGHGTHIEFIQYLKGAGKSERIDPNMQCAAHVCFDVKDIEQTWARLIAAGANAQGEIAIVESGPVQGLKAGYLRDPEGIVIELVEAGAKLT
jgi:catechol 2,3-dioxygenase-like lactoylglutathione lyase family enzyme